MEYEVWIFDVNKWNLNVINVNFNEDSEEVFFSYVEGKFKDSLLILICLKTENKKNVTYFNLSYLKGTIYVFFMGASNECLMVYI